MCACVQVECSRNETFSLSFSDYATCDLWWEAEGSRYEYSAIGIDRVVMGFVRLFGVLLFLSALITFVLYVAQYSKLHIRKSMRGSQFKWIQVRGGWRHITHMTHAHASHTHHTLMTH